MSSQFLVRISRRWRLALTVLFQAVRIIAYRLISTNKVSANGLRIVQPIYALGKGTIKIGDNVTVGVFPSPGYLSESCHIEARSETARISIGDGTVVNNSFTAIANSTQIEIGCRCLIGPRVSIFDSDFHGLQVADRHRVHAIVCKPVKIGDDVFIGAGAFILKGVSVGAGSVVGAGAVVVSDIPENVVVAGNPARILRAL